MTVGSRPDDTASADDRNAWLWHRMDRTRAAALWVELSEWVEWLRETYQFSQGQFPACWYRHGAVREELTALMAAHKAAYPDDATPDAYRSDMTAWHTHEFWPVINRLKAIGGYSECTAQECRHVPRSVATVPGMAEYIAEAVAALPAAAEPEPADLRLVEAAGAGPSDLRLVTPPADQTDEGIRVDDMEAAIAADLAELVDPRAPFGPVRFEDRIWVYNTTAKKYLPRGDS